jgi:alpha-D-xyloside xylohydrolase
LKDYIMSLSANASMHGTPIMTPLWFHFPHDPELQEREVVDSFMFGPKFLAAPVLVLGARNRTVYLPRSEGGWEHYYSRGHYAGGANVTVEAPYDELPLFVRQAWRR